jgi:uncharacterized protein YraI
MQLNKKVLKAGLASIVLLGSAGVAMAAPGFATGNVNVRSGPGTDYFKVGSLRRGQSVDVLGCRSGWCYVQKSGPDGWVSVNYLSAARSANRPVIRFQFNFGNPPRFERPRRDDRDWDWDRRGRDRDDWDRDGRGRDGRDRDGRDRDWDRERDGY